MKGQSRERLRNLLAASSVAVGTAGKIAAKSRGCHRLIYEGQIEVCIVAQALLALKKGPHPAPKNGADLSALGEVRNGASALVHFRAHPRDQLPGFIRAQHLVGHRIQHVVFLVLVTAEQGARLDFLPFHCLDAGP